MKAPIDQTSRSDEESEPSGSKVTSEIDGKGSESTDENNGDSCPDPNEIPKAFLAYPVPNPLVDVETDDDGMVTLIFRKNLGKFEGWLQKKIGGPLDIRRPLDEPGSRIWSLSDGEHNVMEICAIMEQEFKEEISPAVKKVRHFLEQLLVLNLIILQSKEQLDKDRAKEEEERKLAEEKPLESEKMDGPGESKKSTEDVPEQEPKQIDPNEK